jgi:hypothetical protein
MVGWPGFCRWAFFKTIIAINRFFSSRTERHFALLTALVADRLKLGPIAKGWPVKSIAARPASAGIVMLAETSTAINRPVARRTERHFTLLAAIVANRLMPDSGSSGIPIASSAAGAVVSVEIFHKLFLLVDEL